MGVTTHLEEVKNEIVDQLFWDSRLNASNIHVEVSGRKVTLTGKVPSCTAKTAAEADTLRVSGVSCVINNLRIQYPAGFKLPTDIEIRSIIINSLIWNPNLDETNINISVNDGIVTLAGSVKTYWQKILAEEIASDMAGALRVVNNLTVIPSDNIIDESIARAITTSIDRNPNIDIDLIYVEVREGIVRLSGKVPDWAAYYDALNSAMYTVGVVNVINDLRIE